MMELVVSKYELYIKHITKFIVITYYTHSFTQWVVFNLVDKMYQN